jgi:hypothetical protein
MKRKTAAVVSLLTLLVAVLMILGTAKKAPAQKHHGCSDATLRGSYAIHATGNVLSGPSTGPIAIVGEFTYDGSGQLVGQLSQRVNSDSGPMTLFKVPYNGTYIVNSDCTVEDTWFNLSNGTSSIHESTIVDKGEGFVILNTTTGPTVVSGEGRKVFSGESDRD